MTDEDIRFVEMPPFNFGGLFETDYNSASVIIVPIPYDSTTSYQTGARDGPYAIIDASRNMELYDIELDKTPAAAGIYTHPGIEPVRANVNQTLERIERVITSILNDGKKVIALGGEHTISLGVFRALQHMYDSIGVLHFDAHADLRDIYEGSKFGHATVMRRILDYNPKLYSLGIRAISREEMDLIRERQLNVVWSWDTPRVDPSEIIDYFGSTPVFITVDVDFFDPAYVPATGTPEPQGLGWDDFFRIIRPIFESLNVVGFDVVELAPIPGDRRSEFFVARMIYKMIGYWLYL